MRRIVLAAVTLLLASMVFAQAASGISSDTGWTGNNNNNYPAGSSNPNCYPACIAWPAYQTINLVNNIPGGAYQPQINNAMNGWNQAHPYYTYKSPWFYNNGGGSVNVVIGLESNNDGRCADTYWWTINQSPDGRNQLTMYAAVTYVQNVNPCNTSTGNTFAMMTHEIGHVAGLGHTGWASQVMNRHNYSYSPTVPQSRDICGFGRIYEAVSC